MKIFALNVLFAGIFFVLNSVVGRWESGHKIFEYGHFSFNLDEDMSFAGNFVLKTINPAVYVAILCAIFQMLGQLHICNSLWMIVPLYWTFRVIYMCAINILIYTNLKYEFMGFLISLVIGEGTFFLLLKPLIDKNESVFISREELRDAIWYAIFAYVLKITWDAYKIYLTADNVYPKYKREDAVIKKYKKFTSKYENIVDSTLLKKWKNDTENKDEIFSLIYAIMIYEDYNRPFMVRIIEYAFKIILFTKEMTLGVMQVKSQKPISSKTSVKNGSEKIIDAYLAADDDKVFSTICNYNCYGQHYEDVKAIYDILFFHIHESEYENV